MNVPDSWVKEVCEKLGIPEPMNPIGVFWYGDAEDGFWDYKLGELTDTDQMADFPFTVNNDCAFEHFKPLSSDTIAMIKKDLGIE